MARAKQAISDSTGHEPPFGQILGDRVEPLGAMYTSLVGKWARGRTRSAIPITAQEVARQTIALGLAGFPLEEVLQKPARGKVIWLAAPSEEFFSSNTHEIGPDTLDLDVIDYPDDVDQGEGQAMDWQDRYLQKLDDDIKSIKTTFERAEDRIAAIVRDAMEQARHLDEARQRDTQTIHQRLNEMGKKIDTTTNWVIGLVVTALLSITALTLTAIFK